MTSPGNLQWERSRTTDVHCDTTVKMTLILVQKLIHNNGYLQKKTYSDHKIFEAVYEGQFTDCS